MIEIMRMIIYALQKIWNYQLVNVGGNSTINVSNIVVAIILLFVGIKSYNRFKRLVRVTVIDHITDDLHSAKVLEKLFGWLSSLFYLVTVLQISNIPLGTFAFIGGGIGLGIGLGGQNFFNNLMSSIIIMIERPFKLGDIIEITGISGVVSSIGGRCITIVNQNNVKTLIPNSKIIQENLKNWSAIKKVVKCSAEVKITKKLMHSKDSNVDNCENTIKIIENIMKNSYLIVDEPSPKVYLTNIDADNYIYQLEFFCYLSDISSINVAQSSINLAIDNYLKSGFTISHKTSLPN